MMKFLVQPEMWMADLKKRKGIQLQSQSENILGLPGKYTFLATSGSFKSGVKQIMFLISHGGQFLYRK